MATMKRMLKLERIFLLSPGSFQAVKVDPTFALVSLLGFYAFDSSQFSLHTLSLPRWVCCT